MKNKFDHQSYGLKLVHSPRTEVDMMEWNVHIVTGGDNILEKNSYDNTAIK
jgi:hypothetical protein